MQTSADNLSHPVKGLNADGSYDCNKVIRKCKYSARVGSFMICDYLCKEGHSRGGDPHRCFLYRPN